MAMLLLHSRSWVKLAAILWMINLLWISKKHVCIFDFAVNLMMDKIANRPRGFAFIRYATEEESQKAIEGMHGKVISKS